MPSYLITVTNEDAAQLEHWCHRGLRIGPPDPWAREPQVIVTSLEAITGSEAALPETSRPEADAAGQRAPYADLLPDEQDLHDSGVLVDVADIKQGGREEGCPDGGKCHHECRTGCWRVRYASPLSAAGWGDDWPEDVRQANRETDGHL